MTDVFSKKKRSAIMSKIRSTKTEPELTIRPIMKALGFYYQPKGVYGKPDFANKDKKIAVFVDGCFWHGCAKHYVIPKTNRTFWKGKITRNMLRDKEVRTKLEMGGWTVIRVWEHDISNINSLRLLKS